MNLSDLHDFKVMVNLSCTENMVLPDGFTITTLGSPLETVYEIFKLFEVIANLS